MAKKKIKDALQGFVTKAGLSVNVTRTEAGLKVCLLIEPKTDIREKLSGLKTELSTFINSEGV